MPPEKHISVPKVQLLAALKGKAEAAPAAAGGGEQFDELVKLMEGVASFDFMDIRERMRHNFLPFASGARNQVRRSTFGCIALRGAVLPAVTVLSLHSAPSLLPVLPVSQHPLQTYIQRNSKGMPTTTNLDIKVCSAVQRAQCSGAQPLMQASPPSSQPVSRPFVRLQ